MPVKESLVLVRIEVHQGIDALDLVVVVGAGEEVVGKGVQEPPVCRVEGGDVQIVPVRVIRVSSCCRLFLLIYMYYTGI